MLMYHPHAERQLIERNISKKDVEKVFAKPAEILGTNVPKREIAQKILRKSGKKFLYRIIYSVENGKKLIITAYRTTKIKKYLRGK